jgi:hypothetical protein
MRPDFPLQYLYQLQMTLAYKIVLKNQLDDGFSLNGMKVQPNSRSAIKGKSSRNAGHVSKPYGACTAAAVG